MSKLTFVMVGGLVLAAVVYQVLERVPSDSLNVALGVMCGIAASVPVSLGLLLALTRQRQQDQAEAEWLAPEPEAARIVRLANGHASGMSNDELDDRRQIPQRIPQNANAQPQPQIIVIAPPQGQFAQGQFAQGQFPQGFSFPAQWTPQQFPFMHEQANAVDAREWRIIGEE